MARVLVIDDDLSLRQLFGEILEMGGHDAHTVGSAREGLARLSCEPIDLVLTDVVMPDKDGLETIREIRRTHPDVRVVAVSGGGSFQGLDYLHIAKLLGASATLSKPVRMHQLLTTVEEVLRPEAPA